MSPTLPQEPLRPPPGATTAPAIPARTPRRDDEIDVHGLTHPGRVRPDNQSPAWSVTVEERIDALIESKVALARGVLEVEGAALLTELDDRELWALVRLDLESATAAE